MARARPTPDAQATACVCVAGANVLAQRHLILHYGLRGSAYGTLIMRSLALVVLLPINLDAHLMRSFMTL